MFWFYQNYFYCRSIFHAFADKYCTHLVEIFLFKDINYFVMSGQLGPIEQVWLIYSKRKNNDKTQLSVNILFISFIILETSILTKFSIKTNSSCLFECHWLQMKITKRPYTTVSAPSVVSLVGLNNCFLILFMQCFQIHIPATWNDWPIIKNSFAVQSIKYLCDS